MKTNRLVKSIGQDICSAATRGKWKTPKHLLLGTTLRTLTGRADVVTLVNRYGHCQSYSGTLEWETALANQVQIHDSLLPFNIWTAGNKVVHLCWDNFDIKEETPSGAGTTYLTHGIVIQELVDGAELCLEQVTVPKTKQRSLKHVERVIGPCFSKKRSEPTIPVSAATSIPVSATTSNVDMQSLWTFCRGFFNADFKVLDWSGWISKTAENTSCYTKSRIGYKAPLINPITDYATVQQCLVLSKEVSMKLKQEYTLVTMDLAAAKIAFDIVWSSGDQFSKVIVNLGPFHIMGSYMGALGMMLTGSGFEEIVLEAGICASGSINQVMSGKHCNRAMRVHLLMLDSLQRLLLDAYTESTGNLLVDETVSILASCPSHESLLNASKSTTYLEFVEQFCNFKDRVRAESSAKQRSSGCSTVTAYGYY